MSLGFIKSGLPRRKQASQDARLQKEDVGPARLIGQVREVALTENFLDRQLCEIMAQESHPRRGFQDAAKAILLGYRTLGLNPRLIYGSRFGLAPHTPVGSILLSGVH